MQVLKNLFVRNTNKIQDCIMPGEIFQPLMTKVRNQTSRVQFPAPTSKPVSPSSLPFYTGTVEHNLNQKKMTSLETQAQLYKSE